MKQYHFWTNEFGVSDKGIHLLRSGFNYETIAFPQIHNWFVIFVIGLILLVPGIYFAIEVVKFLAGGDYRPHSARMALFLFIPLVGLYFIYTSLQTGLILKIYYGRNRKDKFPLRKIIVEKRMNDFEQLMKNKLSAKFRVKKKEH
jgi:hypothetical protein